MMLGLNAAGGRLAQASEMLSAMMEMRRRVIYLVSTRAWQYKGKILKYGKVPKPQPRLIVYEMLG